MLLLLPIGLEAQTENPYAAFGYEGKVLTTPQERIKEMLLIPNIDTTSTVAVLGIETSKGKYYLFDKKHNILKEGDISQEQLAKFISVDPKAEKYPNLSPYVFVANMPIRAIDPMGKDIYILFYTSNNGRGDEMFKAAALTRQRDIEKGSSFDPKKDKVIILSLQDMATIGEKVNKTIGNYSPKYGKTAEFGVWSHAGIDGPTGTTTTSTNKLDDKQMSMKGWSEINFNWKNDGNGATAGFYGCRTGVNETKSQMFDSGTAFMTYDTSIPNSSFAARISGLNNFSNVNVLGQTSSAYPSQYVNSRLNSENGAGNFIDKENNKKIVCFIAKHNSHC